MIKVNLLKVSHIFIFLLSSPKRIRLFVIVIGGKETLFRAKTLRGAK